MSTETNTVTKFIGDIVFNNGEEDIKVSELATKSELPTVDKQMDAFAANELSLTSPLIPNEEFVYEDSHVLSSLAVKTLVDNNLKQSGNDAENIKTQSLTIKSESQQINLTVTNIKTYECTILPWSNNAIIKGRFNFYINDWRDFTVDLNDETDDNGKFIVIFEERYISWENNGRFTIYDNENSFKCELEITSATIKVPTINEILATMSNKPTGDQLITAKGVKSYVDSTNYATKSELTTTLTTKLTDYRQNNDLSYTQVREFEIEYGEDGIQSNIKNWDNTFPVKFRYIYEGVEYEAFTTSKYTYKFDVDTDATGLKVNYRIRYIELYNKSGVKNDTYYAKAMLRDYTSIYIKLTRVWAETPDEIVMKSELNESAFKTNPNTTITHYCPIEAGEDISNYSIGKPAFLSGHVYRYDKQTKSFVSSTANDSTDCICSVIINGSWKEFVGIITSIDEQNKCITFSSHGDFLFYVDDSNIYQIGDVVLYDGRIVDEDYAMTLKIQQSIVGKITAKINEHYVALFKD